MDSAKPPVEVPVRAATEDLLKGEIPRTYLPDIRNTCPFCAQEIDTGIARCPRCGVPLKGEGEAIGLTVELPIPMPVSKAPPPQEAPAEEHVVVSPPSSEIAPSPAPPEPPKQVEPMLDMVATAPEEALKSEEEVTKLPVPVTVSATPPPRETPEEEHAVVSAPSSEITPSSAPPVEPPVPVTVSVTPPPPETPAEEHVVISPPSSEITPSPAPPVEPPVPATVSVTPPPPETPAEEHVVVSPPSSEIAPSPPPPEPPKEVEPMLGMVTTPPAEAKISSRGLINGRGATNGTGLVNGRGAINGTGLVNGTGMINGTRPGERFASISGERTAFLKRWQFIAILIAIVIVLPTFIYLSYARQSELGADGDFGEWAHVAKFGMQAPAALPEVSVDEWAVKSDANMLYMYLKTESNIVGTSNVNSFFLFVDSDGNPVTGYSVSSVGADYMLELHGWDQKVESASLMRFDSSSDQFNWTSWTNIDSLTVATKAEKLEAMANMPAALSSSARFVLLAQDNMPSQASSVSYPVPEKGGALVIKQEPGTGVSSINGAIPAASSVSLVKLTLRCEGASGKVNSISPSIVGASLASQISDVSLSPGESEIVEIFVDSSLTLSQNFVEASITETRVSSTFADVVVIGEPVRAYVSLPPSSIQIDGAFGDWTGRTSPDNDSAPIANPNIDVTAVGSVNTTSYAAFYVSVQGQVFQGAYVPAVRGKPTSQGGGGGPVVPHRKTGEDILRVYIDSDILNTTGQLIQRSTKVIGADYLLEIDGINGKIVSKSVMIYSSGGWSPVSAEIAAAADSQRIETSVPSTSIGGATSFVAIVETTDWRVRSDWAWTGSLLDPWVIDANGNTYMSSDGSTWSYLGTPTLEPGDRVVDIAVSIGAQGGDIFLVTNTGRTYYWIPETSTSWTAGETNPIDVATYSEAVSMSFYQNSGAWLLTKNGSYFWLMDAHKSTKEWTYQSPPLIGATDYTDLVYDSGTMYALRSGQNTSLNYSSNGNSFTSVTSPTGSTSNHTQFMFLPLTSGNDDDILYVLCENGNIRYSSNGGGTWSALGDLPVPTGSNSTRYVGLGIDPAGYMWVVTDTGYTYRSTDTTTYNNFTCTGQSPIGSIVAILPTTVVIPEFPMLAVPVLVMVFFFVIVPRIKRKQQ